MVVGTLRFVLQIPASASLKAKRQVVRRVVDRIRARFNVSVAEVADNDLWQKATIGVAAVGNDRSFVNEVLDKVLHAVDVSGAECQVVSHELELTSYSDMYGGGSGGMKPERTLAEAEGLVDDEDMPSLEELESAGPPPRRRR